MRVSISVLLTRCFDILILLVWGKTFLKSLILGEKHKPITSPFIVYLLRVVHFVVVQLLSSGPHPCTGN